MVEQPPIVDVAVGILTRPDGKVLMAQRPKGKICSGYWEFPGGKIETGETPQNALVRELQEELGITILSAQPWCCMTHIYPHARVRLHCFIVEHWSGEPVSQENQSLQWQDHITVSPLLPTTVPLCAWLRDWLKR
ncbi:MAG: 8-oxo-dGTP diphosphatase MutT [Oxalobacter sp.]